MEVQGLQEIIDAVKGANFIRLDDDLINPRSIQNIKWHIPDRNIYGRGWVEIVIADVDDEDGSLEYDAVVSQLFDGHSVLMERHGKCSNRS